MSHIPIITADLARQPTAWSRLETSKVCLAILAAPATYLFVLLGASSYHLTQMFAQEHQSAMFSNSLVFFVMTIVGAGASSAATVWIIVTLIKWRGRQINSRLRRIAATKYSLLVLENLVAATEVAQRETVRISADNGDPTSPLVQFLPRVAPAASDSDSFYLGASVLIFSDDAVAAAQRGGIVALLQELLDSMSTAS